MFNLIELSDLWVIVLFIWRILQLTKINCNQDMAAEEEK